MWTKWEKEVGLINFITVIFVWNSVTIAKVNFALFALLVETYNLQLYCAVHTRVKIFSLFITKVNYYIELYICCIVPGTILFYITSLHKTDYISKYYMTL